MTREQWLQRKIELKRQAVVLMEEEIGDLESELAAERRHSLNCAPIYDPFLETEIIPEEVKTA